MRCSVGWHIFSCFCFYQEAGGSESSAARNGSVEDVEPDLTLVNFGVVVAGKERFDVCRLFLASLQLVGYGCRGDRSIDRLIGEAAPCSTLCSLLDYDIITTKAI